MIVFRILDLDVDRLSRCASQLLNIDHLDGDVLAEGTLPQLETAPAQKENVTIPLPPITPEAGVEYWLKLSFRLTHPPSWAQTANDAA